MTAVLDLDGVVFRRDGRMILDGIDLTVQPGEHWALLGPNGAGKSTILGFCGARTHPTAGTVDVLGHRIGRVDLAELRRSIGHVDPRHPISSRLTATEVALTGLTGSIELLMRWEPPAADLARARDLLELVGLGDRRDAEWPTMSQGERGRVLIARALMPRPKLLLLDEPTTGLDVAAREQLLETIDQLEHDDAELASVLVTHHLEELPTSTSHALVIAHGRVVASGPVDEALTEQTITTAFEHPIAVERTDGRWSARAARRTVVPA
jgi:iron complex transport system ATP-binding protein